MIASAVLEMPWKEWMEAVLLEVPMEDNQLEEPINLARCGRYDDALSAFQEHLRQNPNDAQAFFYAGSCFYKMGILSEARQSWERTIQIDPQHAAAKKWLAQIAAGVTLPSDNQARPKEVAGGTPPRAVSKRGLMISKRSWVILGILLVSVPAIGSILFDIYQHPGMYSGRLPFLTPKLDVEERALFSPENLEDVSRSEVET